MATLTLAPAPTVAIIGAGAAGTLTAVNLLRTDPGCRVVLIDRSGRFGPGVAYGTDDPTHVLNVRAAAMGAYPDRPGDFLDWMRRFDRRVSADGFMPRRLFGVYLHHVLEAAESGAESRLTRLRGVAARLTPSLDRRGAVVHLAGGDQIVADACVLALGGFPPADPPVPGLAACSGERYVRDPWSSEAMDQLAGREGDVLLVGTGLTAIDVAMALRRRGRRGVLHAVSRRGLLPAAHPATPEPPVPAPALPSGPATVLGLLTAIRAECAERPAHAVIDSLRPQTARLWRSLPEPERRAFLRHAVRWWDVQRHRLAPEVADRTAAMRRQGRLRVHAGRLTRVVPRPGGVDAWLRPRGERDAVPLRVSAIVNCTGPSYDPAAANEPLVDGLLLSGLARRDPLGLGFRVNDQGALLDALGQPSEILFTIGGLRRGDLWETTALPEIRAQAAALSGLLADRAARSARLRNAEHQRQGGHW